jgi:hypothetical protein
VSKAYTAIALRVRSTSAEARVPGSEAGRGGFESRLPLQHPKGFSFADPVYSVYSTAKLVSIESLKQATCRTALTSLKGSKGCFTAEGNGIAECYSPYFTLDLDCSHLNKFPSCRSSLGISAETVDEPERTDTAERPTLPVNSNIHLTARLCGRSPTMCGGFVCFGNFACDKI